MHLNGHTLPPATAAAGSAPADWPDAARSEDAPGSACINIQESRDLAYWTVALDVSEEKLRRAVATVGAQVDDVRNHFGAVRAS